MAQRTAAPEIPGFRYLEFIGGGGFADVFRYQDSLGRSVAVKVTHTATGESAQAVAAEANLMAKLSSHPNIVSIYQAGVAPDGRTYLVMEECGRDHLGKLAARGLSAPRVMEITIQIAGAVETAHRLGILHRDIKPANILFTGYQIPALTDFGISASSEMSEAANALSPAWAPPEQRPNADYPMGPWSDVFSLAATSWAMLAKRSPLEVPGGPNDTWSLHHRARTFTPVPTGRPDVPDELERVLATALARDPRQRYQSALEFARALQGVQGQRNEAVTQVSVFADEPDVVDADPELRETGTKVTGFLLIDPDGGGAVGGTEEVSTPSGGDTSLIARDAASEPARMALHGRGVGMVGMRDFTGPAVPTPGSRMEAVGEQFPSAPEAPGRRKGSSAGWIIGSAVVVAGVATAGVLWSTGVLGRGATQVESEAPATAPRDPVVARVAPVSDLVGDAVGDQARFTWVNPDPAEGDTYYVDQVSLAEQVPGEVVRSSEVSVPLQSGTTCVEVMVVRGNGAASKPVRGCVEG